LRIIWWILAHKMSVLFSRFRAIIRAGILSAAIVSLAGCSTLGTPTRMPLPAEMANAAMVGTNDPIRYWGDEALENGAFAGRKTKTGDFLSLSGGGINGAYGAGYLVGWTQRGNRPQFDVVTGISVGALIAPLAFLGSNYDSRLTQIFADLATAKMRGPGLIAAFLGAPAIADNKPIVEAIEHIIDASTLDAIAQEHLAGRRLLIGTTNLDAERPVIWDIGAIAASRLPNRLELARQIILASAAVPGIYPPVLINVMAEGKHFDELHVDGGVTQQVLLLPGVFNQVRKSGPKGKLYVIYNGKIDPAPETVEVTSASILQRTIPTLLKYRGRGDIAMLKNMVEASGVDYNLTAMPPEFPRTDSLFGTPQWLTDLFLYGVDSGRRGVWQQED
jgi:hypothetical protein